jgi:hypothetical protein
MSETKEVARLVATLREHEKLKWMTPSKITGETYQMVPFDALHEAATTLEANAREIERLQSDLTRYIDIATKEATEAEVLRARVERQWCLSCGTVTRDGTCDCTKTIPQAQNLVNYADELSKDISTLAGQVSTLTRQAREALEPFAEAADSYDPEERDGKDVAWAHDFTVASLRRARAAIRSLKQGERG